MELNGRHDETVCHEPCQPFEVERWWQAFGAGYDFMRRVGILFIKVCYLDS